MKNTIQDNLIQWYKVNKRDFPWRQRADAYGIWISEIMLQQTTTSAVIPYYNRFMERFPTISDLASADINEVYKLWEGLGYYRRAKHIYESAIFIHQHYNDLFPDNYKDIIELKGIGHYTAGAICSIAYHLPYAAIDGNVLRIMSRQLNFKKNIALASTQKEMKVYIEELLKDCDPSDFNQALMDLGAGICRVKNPKCELCPISNTCLSYKNNEQRVLPINIKKVNHQYVQYITGIIKYKDKYMLIKNKEGLLENLYGFIQYDVESPYSFIEQFELKYHIPIEVSAYIDTIKHVFTHKTWSMCLYEFHISDKTDNLYSLDEISNLAIPTAHLKVLKAYLKSKEL